MGTKTFEGVWFISYSHDHYPAHIHGKYGRVQVVVDLLADGNVAQSKRTDAVRPMNAKRSDVAHVLDVAAAHAGELKQLWERRMDRHPKNLTTDEEIDAAIEQAKLLADEPRIVEAAYHSGSGLEFLMLKLSDGRRLLVPREELGELKDATAAQAMDLVVGPNGVDIYWPQIDDGLYLPDFLQYRWRKEVSVEEPALAA